jgi:ribonucleoside-diphosphate reductase alpha chain
MPLALSPNALTVLERRYLKKDKENNPIEKPEEMFRRVAKAIASADANYADLTHSVDVDATASRFYDAMTRLEFMPNSPTLMNAGRPLGQLAACFVLPIGDSMEDIFDGIKHTALIHKSGGGTGFSFSRLRPRNALVNSTNGVASGPISFMKVFNSATEAVKQGGTRRGANMGILRIDHPDILDFIDSKQDLTQLTNFNISVAITDSFMEAVEKDGTYPLINPIDGKAVRHLRALEVFNKIVKNAWNTGEPGIVFIDKVNAENSLIEVGEIEATNPCGEQPLLPYESCNLGSVNLGRMIKRSPNGHEIDWDKLGHTVRTAVHFLDNVIDVNKFPLEAIAENTRANRKIGLGVMGFADLLVRLWLPYNSPEAVDIAGKVMGFIQEKATEVSVELGERRGLFPNFPRSTFAKEGKLKPRNAALTTVAPTGTISIISSCSSGIEPYFALAFYRNVMDNDKLPEVNALFREVAEQRGFASEGLFDKLAETGTCAHIDEVPDDVKRVFVTSHEIEPAAHIRIQAAFQANVDSAVSKTVNFPNHATEDQVAESYLMAYRMGCKGITVYRDGSRQFQVLNVGKDKEKEEKEQQHGPRPRPMVTVGSTIKMTTGCGTLYVTINEDGEGPCEVFAAMGKAGGCEASQTEAVGRLISTSLRAGVEMETIARQLRGIRCPQPIWHSGEQILSCPDAIGRAILFYLDPVKYGFGKRNGKLLAPVKAAKETVKVDYGEDGDTINAKKMKTACPDCSGTLYFVEGCLVCPACGYSKCS